MTDPTKDPAGRPVDPHRPPGADIHPAEEVDRILEHVDTDHTPVADTLDRFIRAVGHVFCWLNVILVAVIILQVVLRYGFSGGLVVLEELQWHLYGAAVMFGLSYALVNDSHVRVDLLHMRFSDRTKRIVEILGITLLLMPFIVVVFFHSLDFVYDSWRISERSDAPLGLSARWLIKSVIPVSFGLLFIAALSRLIHDVHALVTNRG